MARIRSIKPEFWVSDQVTECSIPARLLFVGLWTFCDDGGRMPFSTKRLKKQIFPADDISSDDIRRMLDELSSNALGQPMVKLYDVDGKQYLQITGWAKHQRIDRPSYQFPDETGVIPKNNGQYARRALDGGVESSRVDLKRVDRSRGESNKRNRARARGSGSVGSDPPSNSTDDWPSDFREQFAEAYPHKVSMAAALAMLDEARKGGKVSWRGLLAGLACYRETKPEDRHWMNPKTWIEQERWNDKPARANGKHERHVADELAEEARRFESQSSGAAVRVGGAELGGDHAQVVPGNKPS
jgi:hypothetical protein